jgi:DNA-binding transcriptional ArsR family regulator
MAGEPTTVQITDSRVLAAMAHPLRQRLLDALEVRGPATASHLAQLTDQAVGNVSHHLRVLGTAGLIEEAPELARDRRERWWRRSSESISWSSKDFSGDSAAEVIADAAASLTLEHHVNHVRAWRTADRNERAAWDRGPFLTDHWLILNDEELAQLGAQVIALFREWSDREIPDDGQERRSVFTFAVGVPGQP